MSSECADSRSDISTSAGISDACYSLLKKPKEIESIQEGVEKLSSEIAS